MWLKRWMEGEKERTGRVRKREVREEPQRYTYTYIYKEIGDGEIEIIYNNFSTISIWSTVVNFQLQTIYIWQGEGSSTQLQMRARTLASAVGQGAEKAVKQIQEGKEPSDFWKSIPGSFPLIKYRRAHMHTPSLPLPPTFSPSPLPHSAIPSLPNHHSLSCSAIPEQSTSGSWTIQRFLFPHAGNPSGTVSQ